MVPLYKSDNGQYLTPDTISVGTILNSSVESTHIFRHHPLEVVDDGVAVRIRSQVLAVIRLVQGNHVLPKRAVHGIPSQSVELVLQSPSCRFYGDFSAVITVLSFDILVPVDIFGPIVSLKLFLGHGGR